MSAGVVLTEEAFRRMVEAVRWVERQRGLTQRPVAAEGGVDPVYVRTTSGTADGSGNYPGVVCLYSASAAAWQEYSAVKLRAANGETLANNKRYPARPSGRTTGGDELYTVHQLIGTDAGLTVAEGDGSPSYGGIGALQFDQADGFVVSNPSSGVAAVDLAEATPTQRGIISTGEQTIGGGPKWFRDKLMVQGNASDEYLYVFDARNIYFAMEGAAASFDYSARIYIDDASAVSSFTYRYPIIYSGNNCHAIGRWWLDSDGVFTIEVAKTAPGGSYSPVRKPAIAMRDSDGTTYTGGSGTVNGVTFVGGVYVSGTGETGLTGTVP